MPTISKIYLESYHRFINHILPAKSVLVVPHDFPDPDALAAAAGVQYLLRNRGVARVDIAFNGFVGRAENRVMVERLEIQHLCLANIDLTSYDKVIVVDSVPSNGNMALLVSSQVDAVLDHHAVADEEVASDEKILYEVHHTVGSTSTLVTNYLLAAGDGIPSDIATALFYGISTDTKNLGRNCFDSDTKAYKYLFDHIDHTTLSRIENPPREPEYLQLLQQASMGMRIWGDFGFSYIGDVTMPDFVPEMADIFHSLKQLEWMMVCATFGEQLIFSVRSKTSQEAGLLTQQFARFFGGTGGGHPQIAAGRLPYPAGLSAQELLLGVENKIIEIFGLNTAVLVEGISLQSIEE